MKSWHQACAAAALAWLLAGCAPGAQLAATRAPMAAGTAAQQAHALLLRHDYKAAGALLNRALSSDPTNAELHFLNALAYHMGELAGEAADRPLADIGYRAALRYDPSNAAAAYCAGLLQIELGNYDAAVDFLAQSLRYDPENEGAMRAFATAAYAAHRPDLALAVSQELQRRHGNDDGVLRLVALGAAALDAEEDARQAAGRIADADERSYVSRRVAQWQGWYQQASLGTHGDGLGIDRPGPGATLTDAPDGLLSGTPAGPPPGSYQLADGMADIMAQMNAQHNAAMANIVATGAKEAAGAGGAALARPTAGAPEPRMAMVDLVIIQTEENSQLAAGVNLLDALTATVQGAAALINGGAGPIGGFAAGHVLGGVVSVPATNYSLNIANSGDNKNDILARPTLVVLDQQPSSFNAGFTLSIAISGSFGGTLEDKNIGLTVTLTPTFLSDTRMLMQVKAARSFFTPVEVNAHGFNQSVEISNVEMTASAVLGTDETLVLSGLAERQTQGSRSQTPLLGDIPGIQYAFSNRTDIESTRTVMFLITPHVPKRFNGELSLRNDDSPAVKALKASETRWFGLKDTPNYLAIMHHFVSNNLYQEYRTGDVLTEAWRRPSQIDDRINQLLTFMKF